MEQAPTVERPTPATTTPLDVWATLTTRQQQTVARIVMRVCQELAAHYGDSNGGEHHAER